MRIILFLFLFPLTASLTAQAQTTPPKKEPAKEAPAKEAPKAEPKKAVEDSIDLDAFFKKGEENAKTSSCDKPATPADPVA